MSADNIRLATRGSKLAVSQARIVAAMIEQVSGRPTRLIEITTTGDADQTTPVAHLTEVGAFVRSVQQAVLDGAADAAVHSCKDLPTVNPHGFESVIPERAEPWDVLVGATLAELPVGARVGTGSPRRAAQLLLLRPDLEVAEIRGNVDTRLAKVESGEYDAAVLAAAGLARLDRQKEITHRFHLDEMVPAPGQGALAIEFLPDNSNADLLRQLDDDRSSRAVAAERMLLAETGAGCRAALGALASVEDGAITFTAFVEDGQGARRAEAAAPTVAGAVNTIREGLGL